MAGRIENLLYYMNIEYNTIGYYVVYVIFDPSKNEFSIYAHLHVSFFAFSYTTRTEDIFVHELAIPKRLWGIFGGLFDILCSKKWVLYFLMCFSKTGLINSVKHRLVLSTWWFE